MANSNFVVQNGLTVGPLAIDATSGDITTSGNISVTGAGVFGGLSSNKIYQGAANVTVTSSFVNVAIGSSNVASFSSTGLTVLGTTTTVNNEFINGNVTPGANVTYNLGSTTAYWNNIYAITSTVTATSAKYADLAENYQADRAYMAGTVVMFGGSAEVTLADADTPAVAGVVSTNPAHLMNGGLTGSNVIPLALQGRVPCQVVGPVHKGDLMVSAGHGFAKVNNTPAAGTVIGKALQEVTFAGKAVIEVVVGRV